MKIMKAFNIKTKKLTNSLSFQISTLLAKIEERRSRIATSENYQGLYGSQHWDPSIRNSPYSQENRQT